MRDIPPTSDLSDTLAGLRPHEFFLIRYVPDVVRGEFFNIGVVVREAATMGRSKQREARVRIAPDYERLQRIFPDAELSYIDGMQGMFHSWLSDVVSEDLSVNSFDKIIDHLSLVIQLTDPQGCLTEDIDAQLESLMRMYVDPHYDKYSGVPRVHPLEALRNSLPAVGNKMATEAYTTRGDTLEFDCMYRTDVAIHIIQAVCIEDGIDAALALAKRANALRQNVLRVEGKPLEITVVTEVPPEQAVSSEHLQTNADAYETYCFAAAELQAAGIDVKTVDDLPAIAASVKRGIIRWDGVK